MKCIAYTRLDGGVSVIHPAPEFQNQIEIIAGKDVPAPIMIYDVPTGRFETVINEGTGEPELDENGNVVIYEIMEARQFIFWYKIIDTSDVPSRETRSAWALNLTEETSDGRGLTKQEFEAKYPELKGWAVQ
jgi:hypothetical protein